MAIAFDAGSFEVSALDKTSPRSLQTREFVESIARASRKACSARMYCSLRFRVLA